VRRQRQENGERRLGNTRLALSREEAAHGASYVDRNLVDRNASLRIAAALFEQRPTLSGLGRRLAAGVLAPFFYQPTGSESEEYHKWYFNTFVWKKTTWMGIDCWKSVADMWNYQEILVELKPSLVIEFGTNQGGSALFFATIMRQIGEPFKVLSVDITHGPLDPAARRDADILFVESRSTVPAIAEHIRRLKTEFPGKIFAILDSDHSMNHVLAEMKLLRPLLSAGDYLIVEDSMLNGHPNLPGWGPGPYEAIEAYEQEFPNDYTHDMERENKFGWTFAPNGFLIRN
jgi:cephalosporin hydroxylase